MRQLLLLFILLLIAGPTMAHEGHGVSPHSPLHYVWSLEHLIPILSVPVLVYWFLALAKRRRNA